MLDMTRAYLDRKVARTPMPTEYANLYREILCKDCNKNCIAPFHIVGMKCKSCGSYNTTIDKVPFLRMEQGEGEEKTYTPLTVAELILRARDLTVRMAKREPKRMLKMALIVIMILLKKIWTSVVRIVLYFFGLER